VYNANFTAEVSFKNCIFEKDVMFKYSVFGAQLSFAGSSFNDEALFKYSKFETGPKFTKSTFKNDAILSMLNSLQVLISVEQYLKIALILNMPK